VPFKLASRIQGPVAVIGDVHGQTDKLHAVLEQLSARPDFRDRWIVFIGDFVDRGPDPKGALDVFADLLRRHPRTTAIAGNHEFAMGGALGWFPVSEHAKWGARWIDHYDSETTFSSYEAAEGDLADLAAKIPASHRQILTDLPWVVEHPQYLFVHAGLDPNTPFAVQLKILQQRDYSLNRPSWLCSKEFVHADPPPDCPVPVVSGHVRVSNVQFRPKRILLDTTGGTDGELSCVLLPEKKVISSAGAATAAGSSPGAGRSWWKIW
jgi:serine/threonine protein phosphatase 1